MVNHGFVQDFASVWWQEKRSKQWFLLAKSKTNRQVNVDLLYSKAKGTISRLPVCWIITSLIVTRSDPRHVYAICVFKALTLQFFREDEVRMKHLLQIWDCSHIQTLLLPRLALLGRLNVELLPICRKARWSATIWSTWVYAFSYISIDLKPLKTIVYKFIKFCNWVDEWAQGPFSNWVEAVSQAFSTDWT